MHSNIKNSNQPLSVRLLAITAIAMIAFAGNSLLCRAALAQSNIDAASFTTIRLIAGALMLFLLVRKRYGVYATSGSWLSAFALFMYAAGFSFAYTSLSAASGALILFGAVQATMICYGILTGERLRTLQMIGLLLAFSGLVGLFLPGLSAPPLFGSILMISAGISWGIYSLRGNGAGNPTMVTAGNFIRAAPFAMALSVIMLHSVSFNALGIGYALLSGALTSGIGYAIWYAVLPALKATHAAAIQLSVPVIAAIGGIIFLGEIISVRLVLASTAILGGITLVIFEKQQLTRTS